MGLGALACVPDIEGHLGIQVRIYSAYFRVLDLTCFHCNLLHEMQERFFKEVGMKQKTKQTGELLNSSLFTAQFATLIVHLKVTGIPACVCVCVSNILDILHGCLCVGRSACHVVVAHHNVLQHQASDAK